jgi:hypothetical protein
MPDDRDEDADATGGLIESVGYHRRVLMNAALQLIPGGASFAELYNVYIPTRRTTRQVNAIESLARKVARHGAMIDENKILSEPYADVFEDVMATVATRQGLEKREYYAALLANALLPEAPEYDRQLRLVACLDALRPSHLRLLAIVVRDLAADARQSASVVGPRSGVWVQLSDETDVDALERDWRDLVDWDLLQGTTAPIQHVGSVPFLKATITDFGREFAAFVDVDEGDLPTPAGE